MMAFALIGIANAVVTGACLVFRITPQTAARHQMLVVKACTALIVGFAIHSVSYLCWRVAFADIGERIAFLLWDSCVTALMCVLAYATLPRSRRAWPARERPATLVGSRSVSRVVSWSLFSLFVIVVEGAAVILFDQAAYERFGAWDAWAIWNLKAKWFVLGGNAWSRVLTDPSFVNAHPDYPLLLPASVARLWMLSGTTSAIVPQAFGCAAAVTTFALLLGVGWALCGPVTGIVAATSVFTIPQFVWLTATQYADIPLSCSYLATLICVAVGVGHNGHRGWLTVGGLVAGAALWTKNEGILFAGSALLAVVIVQSARATFASALISARSILVGLLPFFIVSIGMKLLIPTGNDILSHQSFSTMWTHVTDTSRHVAILSHMWFLARTLPDLIGLLLLLAYVVSSGRVSSLAPAAATGVTLALTSIGYYAIFLITPNDLTWQLTTSGSRLAVQMWPSVILALMLWTVDATVRPTSHESRP